MIRAMKTEPIGDREVRIRVELDRVGCREDGDELSNQGLVEVVEEYDPGEGVHPRSEKIGEIVLTMEEAAFVRDALSEILDLTGEKR